MEGSPQHFYIGSNNDSEEESPPKHEQQNNEQRQRVVADDILHCLMRHGFDTTAMVPASEVMVSRQTHIGKHATKHDFWPTGATTKRPEKTMEPPSETCSTNANAEQIQISHPACTSSACATCGVAPKGRGQKTKMCVLCGTQGSSRNHVHHCYDPTCRSPTCKRCWQNSPYCQKRCWEHRIIEPLHERRGGIDRCLPQTQPPPPPEPECALPKNWHSAYSITHSKWYYWQEGTRESTWNTPTQ